MKFGKYLLGELADCLGITNFWLINSVKPLSAIFVCVCVCVLCI